MAWLPRGLLGKAICSFSALSILLALLSFWVQAQPSASTKRDFASPVGVNGQERQGSQIHFSSSTSEDKLVSPPRIAIIGAGAAGSAASFFLKEHGSKAPNITTTVDIYERRDYVGGRSTVVYPFEGETSHPRNGSVAIELGASIFVAANLNLFHAAKVFNLTTIDHDDDEREPGSSFWDGEQFVFQTTGSRWYDYPRLLWRYGRSPMKAQSVVREAVASFRSLYSSHFQKAGPFRSVEDYATELNFTKLYSIPSSTHYEESGVSPLFIDEIIAAATRVNYGQNPAGMHALEGLVSLAANGASAVVNGNRQIFKAFTDRAAKHGANLHLSTEVTEITKLDAPDDSGKRWIVSSRPVSADETVDTSAPSLRREAYDAIIFASPFHLSNVKVINSDLESRVPPQPYVNLKVTILATNATRPRPEVFGLKPGAQTPRTIMSTFATGSKTKPTFNSLNYLRCIGSRDGIDGEVCIVKMFSVEPMTDAYLEEIFGENNVHWVYRKEWMAYPYVTPLKVGESFAPILVDDRFYYVNGFERLVSTMETETVAAENVVHLVLEDFFGYKSGESWAGGDQTAE